VQDEVNERLGKVRKIWIHAVLRSYSIAIISRLA
jgi:hypothetical protein